MTLVPLANNIGSDAELILREFIHIFIMNRRGPRIIAWELHVSVYLIQQKNFELN